MRSRDGNHTLSRSISALTLLLCSLALHAGEYLISYRYSVHDAILYNETLDISRSMQKCPGEASQSIIFASQTEKDLTKIVARHNEEFIDFIHKLGLSLEHKEQTRNYQNHSVTILTLKTTCFKVDFNDTFVKISHLKSR